MDIEKMLKVLEIGTIEWRKHALERMLQRGISRNEVKETLMFGEIIENYETDVPFSSALFFHLKTKAIHVVASLDEENMTVYIITAYLPDSVHFNEDLKTRRENENS